MTSHLKMRQEQRLCLRETALLPPQKAAEKTVSSTYLLAEGELFIFKLKTHQYLGNAC